MVSPEHNSDRRYISVRGWCFGYDVVLAYQEWLVFQEELSVSHPVIGSLSESWEQYGDPEIGHSLIFPPGWTVESDSHPEDFENFRIESPDYKVSEGYPVLEQGAKIETVAKSTKEEWVEEFLNKNPLYPKIAEDIREVTVDDQKATQYDYTYEMVAATKTVFIKDGICHAVEYRYVDPGKKRTNWDTYERVLDSFEAGSETSTMSAD